MPSGSWLNGFIAGDIVTAAEFKKGTGCVFDSIAGGAVASIDTGAVIPTTYAHLRIMWYLRGDTAAVNTAVNLRLDNGATASYDYQLGTFTTAAAAASQSVNQTAAIIGTAPAATAAANMFGVGIIDIPYYSNATNLKSGTATWFAEWTAATNTQGGQSGFIWRASTAVINQVSLFPAAGNFVAGSRMSVYVMGF